MRNIVRRGDFKTDCSGCVRQVLQCEENAGVPQFFDLLSEEETFRRFLTDARKNALQLWSRIMSVTFFKSLYKI